MKTHRLIGIAAALCLSLPAFPVEAEIDRKRMKQDLDIMEGILKSIHAQTTSNLVGVHREPQVRGLYFENYGVIFLIEELGPAGYSLPGGFPDKVTKVFETHSEGDVTMKFKEQVEKRRTDIQNRLAEFLGTYADAIRQLKDTDRISILIFLQRLSPYGFDLESAVVGDSEWLWAKQSVPRRHMMALRGAIKPDNRDSIAVRAKRSLDSDTFFYTVTSDQVYSEVTVKKGDIVAYRRERIDDEEFIKRIAFLDHRRDASLMKKIGVMSAILDKALTQAEHPVPRTDATRGIYQNGLGALFFVNAKRGPRTFFSSKTRNAPKSPVNLAKPRNAVKGDTHFQERFKDELVEAVGDYGYTLRTLEPDEYILLDVRFSRGFPRRTSDPRGLVLKVKKRDVDAYSRGELDLAAFRKKADIQEY